VSLSFEEIYRKYEHLTLELSDANEPLECAGAMMGQAMKLYKLILTTEEFDALMVIISQASGLDGAYDGVDDGSSSGTIH
tara:strand:+ start:191 stop:430 length:240 start_codon:yes stop_codon:yes gene_type:complete